VKTLVMEPMSNTVSPFTGRLSPNPIVPYETICDPLESIIPTTIPVACFCTSTRVDNIFRIASSSGIGEACDSAGHVAPAIKNMTRTKRFIGLTDTRSLLVWISLVRLFDFLIMFIVGLSDVIYAFPECCSIVSNDICGLQRLCFFI
jgi:hypothetical protein